jgi:galactokinase
VTAGGIAAQSTAELFRSAFGVAPAMAASAPGRVNLIGEHLDYNGGPVFPVAVERRTVVAVAPAADWRFVSTAAPEVVIRRPHEPMRSHWTDYLIGVVQELGKLDAAPEGACIAVGSTLPIGVGLSSSAALTVAGAAALARLAGREPRREDLVEIAYRAEHDRVGVRCGRMDQTIAALARPGSALLLDTATGAIRYSPLPAEIWVLETGTSHRLTGGELNQRREECEQALAICRRSRAELTHLAQLEAAELIALGQSLPPRLFRRVRHVVTETARTRSAADALDAGDLRRLGALLVAAHASLRNDYESSVPEADLIVEAAVRHGAYGARLTGAGWGGAVVMLAPSAQGGRVVEEVGADFLARFGRQPEAWATSADAGVRIERLSGAA